MNAPFALVNRAASAAPELSVLKTEGVQTHLLAALRSERAELGERLAQINAILAKLEAAAAAEREALAHVAELGLEEIGTVKDWASGGCVGAAPTPDMTRRDALNRRLGEAIAAAEAMRAVAADLRAEHGEISTRLVALEERIEVVALDQVVSKFETDLAGLARVAEEVQSHQARVWSCSVFLRLVAERHMTSRPEKGLAIYRRLEQLVLPQIEFQPSAADVASKAPAWAAIYEGLIHD